MCSLLAAEDNVVLVRPHTPFCSHCAPPVGGGEHVSFSRRRADFSCSSTWFVCSCACLQVTIFILPLHLLAPFSSRSFIYLRLPFTSHHCYHLALLSFALCLSGFLLFHSPEVPSLLLKMSRSILSIFFCLLLGGSET